MASANRTRRVRLLYRKTEAASLGAGEPEYWLWYVLNEPATHSAESSIVEILKR